MCKQKRCAKVRPNQLPESFEEAMQGIAQTRDGAVVISVDGIIQEQLVRFRNYRGILRRQWFVTPIE